MTIHTNNIDHIWLWVSSLERSQAWYEKVFDFRISPREGDPATLLVESEKVHFFLRQQQGDTSWLQQQHLSLRVDDLDTVIEQLQAMGIKDIQTGVMDCFSQHNYRWCEWPDPDGIRIECVQWLD